MNEPVVWTFAERFFLMLTCLAFFLFIATLLWASMNGTRNITHALTILCVVVVWAMLILLLITLVIEPWKTIVHFTTDHPYRNLALFLVGIFACSCSEIAISATTDEDIAKWGNRKARGVAINERSWSIRARTWFMQSVKYQESYMNSIIILANTIFVIGLTVFTTNQVNAENHGAAQIAFPFFGTIALPMEANDAFTGIGVTIILFVLAEMVPKQFANNLKADILAWLWIWIIPVTAIFFIPAFGMAKPFEFLIARFGRREA